MGHALDALIERQRLIGGLRHASSVLAWDQHTYLPSGAAGGRARALGAVGRVAHEMATSAEYGALLDAAEREGQDFDPASDEAALLLRAREEWEQATRLPADFVAEVRQKTALANQVWQAARRDNDFARFAPALAEVIELQRRKVALLGWEDHPYDALLDPYEPGMKTADVRAIFATLREQTVPLAQRIARRADAVDDAPLRQPFDEARQWALAETLLSEFGYRWEHGRMDRSPHPFCTTFASDDVRVTIRLSPTFFNPCFFAAAHECGHALYNQGLPAQWEGTSLWGGASAALHESQSRLWENLVGRSRAFWQGFYPRVQAAFPEQLGAVDEERFFRAVNRVGPSLNRVEADEVTYNLHIMVRFDLEVAMMEDEVDVAQLPALWNAKMEEFLGVVPERDADGVLQDMHWAVGLYGYFPTYALGNVVSAQLWDAARRAQPDLPAQLAAGDFAPLLAWMRATIHQQGRKFLPQELIQRATGQPLSAEPYVKYLEEKFADIYG